MDAGVSARSRMRMEEAVWPVRVEVGYGEVVVMWGVIVKSME